MWPKSGSTLEILGKDCIPNQNEWAHIEVGPTAGFGFVHQKEYVADAAAVHTMASKDFERLYTKAVAQRPETLSEDLWTAWRAHVPGLRGSRDAAPVVLDICARARI